MSQEYKLKDIQSFASLNSLDKIEVDIEGIEGGKVLLIKLDDKVHALSPRCSHYGAPLKNGVVTGEGRLTCPWHGACFNVTTGDVEDAPAPNALNKFEVFEKEGGVYIIAKEEDVKAGQRNPVVKCSVSQPDEKLVVVGGGSGTLGLIQAIRELKYPGAITIISKEPDLIIDRTKLSKALITDPAKIQWRPREWYTEAAIETITDEVTAVDFEQKTVSTKSGQNISYTKLVLATGGVPRTLPLQGFKGELNNVFTLRTIQDVQSILAAAGEEKRNIVVIGSSFIGMEVGNALSKSHNVTIVGMESSPMERVMGTQVGRIFQGNLEKSGIKFNLSANVSYAAASPSNTHNVGAVHLKDGTTLPADLVILGVGVRPATDFLRDNKSISLEKDGSIKTTAHFLVPGLQDSVFAIGDIATYPYFGPGADATGTPVRIEHWNVAQNSGRAAARAIVHTQRGPLSSLKPKTFIPVFWSALGAQLRYCGNPVNGFDDVIVQEKGEAKFVAFYTAGETVVAVASMGVDPVMSKSSELMRAGKMPGKAEILAGADVLSLKV
ncbi:Pyridine nucleotide-disulfide oxidoreductase, dimerization [Penicillium griseofulvum]|uniref:Pyridine nucleotide-disulfide oxidoreductase, dimerization n=1 Tax=Penicillium patulum TaxID=5078 RepID=A0A135LSC3_PENPA|nr:Pyridine nucleotide-disulfide oxidoreductase, dimerization [Penicillium griseofulvum]KXG51874.1 Pyridine nucleotide-disulfide oxidoreductase, dimerization [Penicillium griseofulvum]